MTEAENAIFDLELQIRWIRDNEHHQFPGWMNTIMAMEQAIRLINKQNIVLCKDCKHKEYCFLGRNKGNDFYCGNGEKE